MQWPWKPKYEESRTMDYEIGERIFNDRGDAMVVRHPPKHHLRGLIDLCVDIKKWLWMKCSLRG